MKIGPMKFGKSKRRAPKPILTEATQQFSFTRRAMLLGGAQAVFGGVLVARMAYISVVENERYNLLSESNRVNMTLIPPRRGWIVDRFNKEIATNRIDLRVDIIPDRVRDKEGIVTKLQQLLSLDAETVARVRSDMKTAQGFQPVQVSQSLTQAQYDAVNVHLPELPGVAPARGFSRYYPTGAAVAHLVGYVGAANAEQYKKEKDPLLITPGFKVGKDGIEKVLDAKMRGQPGAKRSEVTARGKLVRELETKPDVMGGTVHMTVDAGLQEYAARRMGLESGSCTVIDLLTGDILAMVSMPAFDPNSFSDGIGHIEWKMLREDDHKPLLNKTLQGLYPPGSTVKPAAAMAALGAGIDPNQTVYCPGGYRLGNRTFRCLGVHGHINMRRALAKSCNTYFYSMAARLGYDVIAKYASALGLGQKFDLPVPSQYYGTVPTSEWKMRKYKQAWTTADSLNATIGQGYLSVSPLQLAVMAARVASGKIIMPRLLMGKDPILEKLPFPEEHFAVVREGMDMVVNGDGTAGRSRLPFPDIKMAGKTGTAQVRRGNRGQGGAGTAYKYRDHGLFVCFAPVDNPRYAASVVIDHGMGGSRAAAPVASDVLTFLFDQEKAMAKLHALEGGWGGDLATRMARKAATYEAMSARSEGATEAEEEAAKTKEEAEKVADANNDGRAEEAAKKKAEVEAAEAPRPEPKAPPRPADPLPSQPAQSGTASPSTVPVQPSPAPSAGPAASTNPPAVN